VSNVGPVLDRKQILDGLRPSIIDYLGETEAAAGVSVIFHGVPAVLPARALAHYDTDAKQARIEVRPDWCDYDIAHEVCHLNTWLIQGFGTLKPRPGASQRAIGARLWIENCVSDHVVTRQLLDVRLGLRFCGEVIDAAFFSSCAEWALRMAREEPLDTCEPFDAWVFYLARLVWAALLLERHAEHLRPEQSEAVERFRYWSRNTRPKETEQADKVLKLFRNYDVHTPKGHGAVMSGLVDLHGLGEDVRLRRFERLEDGTFDLVEPPR